VSENHWWRCQNRLPYSHFGEKQNSTKLGGKIGGNKFILPHFFPPAAPPVPGKVSFAKSIFTPFFPQTPPPVAFQHCSEPKLLLPAQLLSAPMAKPFSKRG
jgi:hypothetical protein